MRFLSVAGRLSFAAFLCALALALAAAFGTRLGYWDYRFGVYTLLIYALWVAGGALLLGLFWIATALAANKATDLRFGLAGFLGSLVVLGIPLYHFLQAYGRPPIHDITTDVEHPPEFVALLYQRQDAVNPPDYEGGRRVTMDGKTYTVTQLQKKFYGDIHTIGQLMPPERLFNRALAAAKAMGWTIVAVAPDEGRIEATNTTLFFGFVSDIVIRVKPSGMGARLDIRSESRILQDDGGDNAAYVRGYVKMLASE